jgi:outer membrane protein OmpA-like peptidoglycan-associated protein
MKNTLLILFLLLNITGYGQSNDTFQVLFPLNDSKVNTEISGFIDNLIFKDELVLRQKLIVLGYADYLGDNKYNDALSLSRAKNVKDYLISMGFQKDDIKLCIGKGKIARTPVNGKEGYPDDRKVEIIVDHEVHMDTPKAAPAVKKTDLTKLKVNEVVALNNISFVGGRDSILPSSFPELQKLLNFLKENKTVKIRIEGHICCWVADSIDTHTDNYLSERRAVAIYHYLVKNGIDKSRMRSIGLGTLNPVVKNEKTEADYTLNRRVEIRILSK